MNNTPKSKLKKRRWPLVLLIIAVILTAIVLDSRLRLTVTEYQLGYNNLPESFNGYRIVQLSDLHLQQFGADNERLLNKVKAQNPDLIVLTGDFINRNTSGEDLNQSVSLRAFFEELAPIAPAYFVTGNHEWASGEQAELESILTAAGIKCLKNEFTLLERGGDQIVLAGVDDPNGPADMTTPTELVSNIRESCPESFVVFLGHRDDWLERYPMLDVDIIFCGHAHGGIVRLPFAGGVLGTSFNLFPKYDAGVFNEGGYDMVLSRGLGNNVPVPRFLNPPQIVTVILQTK